MLSIEHLLVLALSSCSLACSAFSHAKAQQRQSSTVVVCPASIDVTESVVPTPGWSVGSAKQQRRFERISIYNGRVGGREFELAPDDQKEEGNRITQTWSLKGYRTMNIFLRCRYHDTSAVLYMDLPPETQTCSLRFVADKRGTIVGQSDMTCR
jgi:hypothetical protein